MFLEYASSDELLVGDINNSYSTFLFEVYGGLTNAYGTIIPYWELNPAVGFKTIAGTGAPSDVCSALGGYNGVIEINQTPTSYQCSNATGSYQWNALDGGGPYCALAGCTITGNFTVGGAATFTSSSQPITADNGVSSFGGVASIGNISEQKQTLATSTTNQSSPTFVQGGQVWNGTGSSQDQWAWQNVETNTGGANGTSVYTLTNSGLSGITYSVSFPNIPVTIGLHGTTSTITGTALTATCDSGMVTVTGATVGNTVGVSTTDGTDIGGAFNVRASVTATNTITVYVCGTGTPASKAYNVTTY
jgi:hypothetical protein